MIKKCPFCGYRPKDDQDFYWLDSEGTKWGRGECVECGGSAGEVRTRYDLSGKAAWHDEYIIEWNTRDDG